MRRLPLLHKCLLLGMVLITLGCDGCKTAPSQTASTQAASSNRTAIEPRLDSLAKAHPELAGKVSSIETSWQDDRATLDQVKPLMQTYTAEHPTEKTAVDNVLWSWDHRLTEFGK